MGLVVNYIWGGSGRAAKDGLGRVLDAILEVSEAFRAPAGPADPTVQITILVPGDVWRPDGEGFTLEPLTTRGRDWLGVTIFVPASVADEEQSVAYFRETLAAVSDAVEERLRTARPDWAVEGLLEQIRQLSARL